MFWQVDYKIAHSTFYVYTICLIVLEEDLSFLFFFHLTQTKLYTRIYWGWNKDKGSGVGRDFKYRKPWFLNKTGKTVVSASCWRKVPSFWSCQCTVKLRRPCSDHSAADWLTSGYGVCALDSKKHSDMVSLSLDSVPEIHSPLHYPAQNDVCLHGVSYMSSRGAPWGDRPAVLSLPRNWFFCVGGLQLKFGCHRKASLSCARNWSVPFPGSWSGKIQEVQPLMAMLICWYSWILELSRTISKSEIREKHSAAVH